MMRVRSAAIVVVCFLAAALWAPIIGRHLGDKASDAILNYIDRRQAANTSTVRGSRGNVEVSCRALSVRQAMRLLSARCYWPDADWVKVFVKREEVAR